MVNFKVKRPKRRNKKQKPITQFYKKLESFRKDWESKGGTRGSLRKVRKQTGDLFPEFQEA